MSPSFLSQKLWAKTCEESVQPKLLVCPNFKQQASTYHILVALVTGKPNQYEVLVQGKQGKAVTEYLMSKGVPKKWIELEDTTEKKKGK